MTPSELELHAFLKKFIFVKLKQQMAFNNEDDNMARGKNVNSQQKDSTIKVDRVSNCNFLESSRVHTDLVPVR